MISELQQIFGSRMKALEIFYLLHDSKPVVRHGFYDSEIRKVEEFCEKHNLFLEKSPYKVLLKEKASFTNRGKVVSLDNSKGMVLVYISKNQFDALWVCLNETRQDQVNTGLKLGYPKCCVNFFSQEFKKGNLNPVHNPTNMWTNLSHRDEDVVLLSHFPCSNNCDSSIKQAKKRFDLLKKHNDVLANYFEKKLSEN